MKADFHQMLFKTFHAQRNRIRQDMKEIGLSPGQPKVLRYLTEHKQCMLKDIAEACDVENATISRILNNLEEQEMIKREVVKNNKRALSITILPKGEQALATWEDLCKEIEKQSLQGFDENEIELLKNYLHRMYQNLTGKNF